MHVKGYSWLTKSLGFCAAFFMLSAMMGGYLKYSPVPYLDMWDGYVNFYLNIQDGHWSAWWARHNEHIIFLSRILFWIDIYLFNGTISFLIICHYLIALVTAALLSLLLYQQIPEQQHRITRINLQFIICILTFSWLQKDNFSVGFQSQFFFSATAPPCVICIARFVPPIDGTLTQVFCISLFYWPISDRQYGEWYYYAPVNDYSCLLFKVIQRQNTRLICSFNHHSFILCAEW